MPARAIGSGTIAFGLVSIPVKLFPSVSPSDGIRFNQLHAPCGTRVKQQYWCAKEERTVSRDEIVKGYEFAKGRYVTFSPDELKAVEAQSTGSIDIDKFVPLAEIDPIYYAKAYYLGPDGSSRAYHLLAEALRRTGLCAVSTYSARGKQYLALLRPTPEGLLMQQLHYPAEVRPVEDVDIDAPQVNEAELQLAIQLIEQASSGGFEPTKYTDEVRERVEALIQKKVDGEDITQSAPASTKTQVIDLMAALKQSLGVALAPTDPASSSTEEAGRKGTKRAPSDSDVSPTPSKVSSE